MNEHTGVKTKWLPFHCWYFLEWKLWYFDSNLTHWGRVTHICVSDLTIIGSDDGLSPAWRQANIRTNVGILLIRPLGTNFSEFFVEILIFSFKKMCLKVSSPKMRPFCLGLDELTELYSWWSAISTVQGDCERVYDLQSGLWEKWWARKTEYIRGTNNNSTLVQDMVRCRTGDKPLPGLWFNINIFLVSI